MSTSGPDCSERTSRAAGAEPTSGAPGASNRGGCRRLRAGPGARNSLQLVDLARREEAAGQGGAALDQQRGHARAGPSSSSAAGIAAGPSPATGTISAPARGELGRALGRSRGGGEDDHRRLVECLQQLRVERQASPGVEDDPRRLPARADVAGGEQGIVGERRADADGDRVGLGAPAMDQLAAAAAGDPLRVARGRRGAAVEAHRRLADDQRPAGARVLAEGLDQSPCRRPPRRPRRSRPRSPRRAGSRGRGRWPSTTGRRCRSRRERSRRRRSRPCRGAGGPGGRTARGSRTWSRRRGRCRERRSRRARPPPRARRRARRGSPRRGSRRRARRRLRPAGWG